MRKALSSMAPLSVVAFSAIMSLASGQAFNSTSTVEICGHENDNCRPIVPGEYFAAIGPFVLIPLIAFLACLSYAFLDENPDFASDVSSTCDCCTNLRCGSGRTSPSSARSTATPGAVEMTVQSNGVAGRTRSGSASDGGTSSSVDETGSNETVDRTHSAPPAAAAAGGTANPLTSGADGPPVYRVSEKQGEHSLGCFKFNNTLLGSVGVPDEHASDAFSVSPDCHRISSHNNHSVPGLVVVPLSPSLFNEGGDVYVDVKRNEMQPLDAALVVLPTALIGPGIERLWVGEVQLRDSALETAKRVFGLEREQGWAMFCSGGKQFSCNGQVAAGEELPWWPHAKHGKRTTVGCQLPRIGVIAGVTKQKHGTAFGLRRPGASLVDESLSAVFLIPAGVHLNLVTDQRRVKELRGSNSSLYTPFH